MNLIHGCCLEELTKLDDKSVDFVYLDLPFGQTALAWDVKLDLKALWVQLRRVAKNDRTPFFFSCTTKFGFELFNNAPKGWFRWDLVWKKNRAAGFLNAYRLPMRKHEMVYCFAKSCPAYDVSSHSEYEEQVNALERPMTMYQGLKKNNKVKSKTHKVPLPTSDITQPSEEHELVYCFAKKSPEYDVSSHKEFKEGNSSTTDKIDLYGMKDKKRGKKHKDPLPHSDITPPAEEKVIVDRPTASPYGAGIKDVYINGTKGGRTNHKDPLPTSDVTQEEEAPSSWCEYNLDNKIGHRTAKPVKLMEFLLKYWTKEGDVVLDPTAGSGSMGVACKNMNRNFIGIEKDDEIFKLMSERLENI